MRFPTPSLPITSRVISFQFSLWDSALRIGGTEVLSSGLSILFMRFFQNVEQFWHQHINPLSILFMRFCSIYCFLFVEFIDFQFSLWDSILRSEVREILSEELFQFSLWDSRKEFWEVIENWFGFQFSLWDSDKKRKGEKGWECKLSILFMRFRWCKTAIKWNSFSKLSILFMRFPAQGSGEKEICPKSFNSLYEILTLSNSMSPSPTCFLSILFMRFKLIPPTIKIEQIYNFQFSLWDSGTYFRRVAVDTSSLSILFMRFSTSTGLPIHIIAVDFQFSLWDSKWEMHDSVKPASKQLSILFMRFRRL